MITNVFNFKSTEFLNKPTPVIIHFTQFNKYIYLIGLPIKMQHKLLMKQKHHFSTL